MAKSSTHKKRTFLCQCPFYHLITWVEIMFGIFCLVVVLYEYGKERSLRTQITTRSKRDFVFEAQQADKQNDTVDDNLVSLLSADLIELPAAFQQYILRILGHGHFTPHSVGAIKKLSTAMRVACITRDSNRKLGSFQVRCKELSIWMSIFGSGRYEIIPRTVQEIQKETTKYKASIFVKTLSNKGEFSEESSPLGAQFVDVIDNKGLKPKGLSLRTGVIVLNENQQEDWNSTHHTWIIQHAVSFWDDMKFTPKEIEQLPLRAATFSEWGNSGQDCYDVHGSSFTYSCINLGTPHERENLFQERLPMYDVSKIIHNPLGTGFLFAELFRTFDVIVVPVKRHNKGGWKVKYGAIQRMTNAMASGVVVAVEAMGTFLPYVSNYECAFRDADSLKRLLEELARNIELNRRCRQQAKEIVFQFSPYSTVQKYEAMLDDWTVNFVNY